MKSERVLFFQLIKVARALSVSSVVLIDRGLPSVDAYEEKRVDIWWRGQENGSLMLILAYLLCHNLEWSKHRVRVLRAVRPNEDQQEARAELESILYESRIRGEAKVVTIESDFKSTLTRESRDATVVFLGFNVSGASSPNVESLHAHFFFIAQ